MAIEYIGLRPGERLHETLFHADERYNSTIYPDILQAEPRAVMPERMAHALERLWAGVRAYDLDALAHALREAVPEFNPVDEEANIRPATVVLFPDRRAKSR